ncbi:MAG TPA: type II toxin-antitoxin system VapC family toxin [Rhodocyclaceae bacterium]|nr:type II toxin-antitoxin system VapC family toxin [Rhodocyclaceae bacterium]
MSRLVLDASVILKWYLNTGDEADLPVARAILEEWMADRVNIILPPHALAEVASVLASERAEDAGAAFSQLQTLFANSVDNPNADTWQLAIRLSITLNHHLFDTLYHAMALALDATLVTADERYQTKANSLGHIVLLRDLQL